MFRNIVRNRPLINHLRKAAYIRGFWPEPITQQNLQEFLHDINYFEEPREFINIGLKLPQTPSPATTKTNSTAILESLKVDKDPENVDKFLELLSHEDEAAPFDPIDARLKGKDLIDLAINSGVFRDLLGGSYKPEREHIRFTREQAERLDKLVPYYWITDQPFARVDRHPRKPDPLVYFEPVVGLSARFVHMQDSPENQQPSDMYAHTSFYGNIIPASEAIVKPSITLDGRILLGDSQADLIEETKYDNWEPGRVELVNFGKGPSKYHTIALVNLDYLHDNCVNLHWMLTNIEQADKDSSAKFEEVCSYLPVHGIRGFGYSRYVFVAFQHDTKLDSIPLQKHDFSLETRKFDVTSFLNSHKGANLVPVGISWFQTIWDLTSNNVFHDYLNLKAPVYDHVQTQAEKRPKLPYPGRVPFNILLDHERDKKEIDEQVLLERLKTVNPFDYKDQYVPPKVPKTVFEDDPSTPHWMRNVLFKKKNKIGYWRGLRPTSAILPLDNNADLDYPLRPVESAKKAPPGWHNQYPGRERKKAFKDMPVSKPINEHEAVYVQDDHEVHLKEVMKIMEGFKVNEKKDKPEKRSK